MGNLEQEGKDKPGALQGNVLSKAGFSPLGQRVQVNSGHSERGQRRAGERAAPAEGDGVVLRAKRFGNLEGTKVHCCQFCLEIWRGRGAEVKSFNW